MLLAKKEWKKTKSHQFTVKTSQFTNHTITTYKWTNDTGLIWVTSNNNIKTNQANEVSNN